MMEILQNVNYEHLVLGLILFNIATVLIIIWVIMISKENKENFEIGSSEYRYTMNELMSIVRKAEEVESSNVIEIENLHLKIESLEKEIEYLNQSIARFGPELDKNKNWKTVTVLNGKLE